MTLLRVGEDGKLWKMQILNKSRKTRANPQFTLARPYDPDAQQLRTRWYRMVMRRFK